MRYASLLVYAGDARQWQPRASANCSLRKVQAVLVQRHNSFRGSLLQLRQRWRDIGDVPLKKTVLFLTPTRVLTDMPANLLSFCPTLVTKDHHQKDGKWFGDKEPIDPVNKAEANDASHFSGGDFFRAFRPCCRMSLKDCFV